MKPQTMTDKGKTKKEKSIRKRVLLYSIEIILVAVFGTALILSVTSYNIIRTTAQKHSDLMLGQVSNNIETKMDGIDKIVQTICLNTDLLDHLYQISKGERNESNSSQINKTLNNYLVLDNYIDSVQIYSANSAEFFLERGLYNRNERIKFQEIVQDFKAGKMSKNVVGYEINGVKKVVFLFEIHDYLLNVSVGVGMIVLNPRLFDEAFLAIQNENDIQFVIMDQRDLPVYQTRYITPERLSLIVSPEENRPRGNANFGNSYIMAQTSLWNYGWTLISQISIWEQLNDIYQAWAAILLLSLVGLIAVLAINRKLTLLLVRPIERLSLYMGKVEKGEFGVQIETITQGEIGYLQKQFNRMNAKIAVLLSQAIQREKLKRDAEISMLAAQINPHFLYNTLNTINCIAKINQQSEISAIVVDLGDILRYSITNSNELVVLAKEMQYLQKYCSIMNVRFDGNILLVDKVSQAAGTVLIPKLLFQPLVENALKYAFCEGMKGVISIQMLVRENGYEFIVEDNGVGVSPDQCEQLNWQVEQKPDSNEIGLRNVNQRVKLYYGGEYGLWITSQLGKGTQIHITIGKETRHELDESVTG